MEPAFFGLSSTFPHTVRTGNAGLTEKEKKLRVEKLALTKQECWHVIDKAWAFRSWLSDLDKRSEDMGMD